jgi:hypothetical protein
MKGIMNSHTPIGFGFITDRAIEFARDRSRSWINLYLCLRFADKIRFLFYTYLKNFIHYLLSSFCNLLLLGQ